MRFDFDWVSIGGGTAGEVAAGMAASLGARTAIVERERLGGECLWHGCTPSKALIHLASQAYLPTRMASQGITFGAPAIDFACLMGAVHQLSESIYEEMAGPRAMGHLGVEILQGRARFLDPHTLAVEDVDGAVKKISARYILIATGSRARVPPIPGLGEVPFLTDANLFTLEALPARLLVIGAGAVGLEMGQAFHRLGSAVHVVDVADRVLARDDAEHATLLADALRAEGLQLALRTEVRRIARDAGGIRVEASTGGEARAIVADAVLVATGREPAVDGLDLEAAGLACDARGITVDRCGRTRVRHIFAAGDVATGDRFTHVAENMAKAATTTALIGVPMAVDRRSLSWCTFTSPELGQLGETEASLEQRGARFEVHRLPFRFNDRARTAFDAEGQVKVLATRWRGRILGVSIVGPHAGDMLCEWALAMRNGLTLRNIADTIHPYPTYLWGGVRRAADQWYVRRRPTALLRMLARLRGFRGTVNELGKDGTPM